jgi:hypothetical protein
MTIFYCLKFEIPSTWRARLYSQALISLFVASYDSQGYGGGIGPRIHTGWTIEVLRKSRKALVKIAGFPAREPPNKGQTHHR